jgi:elongation factor P
MNIPLKRGQLLRHQGHLYTVTDFSERHSGKQCPTVHVLLRDVRDGHPVDRTLDQLEPLEEVPGGHRELQYLYPTNEAWVFMDIENYEQYELRDEHLHGCQPFLKEGEKYRALFAGELPVMLDIPDAVMLKVRSTAPPTHGGGSQSSVLKEASLENGLEIRVPLFIKDADMIRVSTRDRSYMGKES